MRIAVFGAAFDPPHLGHAQIAHYLVDQNLVDEVWWVPVQLHPFGKPVTEAVHRLKMIELTLDGASHQKINDFELQQVGPSYSLRTLRAFQTSYPQHDFSFVMGSDNLAKFHLWHHYQALLAEFPFWVYPRAGSPFEPLYQGMKPLTDAPVMTVSSTEIRKLVAQGESLIGLVAPAVEQYIKTHQLYVS